MTLVCKTDGTRIQLLVLVQTLGQLFPLALLKFIRKISFAIDFPRCLFMLVSLESLRSREDEKENPATYSNCLLLE